MTDIAESLFGYRTEVKRLEAEIARLRGLYDSATDQAVRYADDNERLQFLRASDAARLEKYYAEIARLQASLKMTNGGERQLSAFLKLEAENERLRYELSHCPRDMQVADGMIRDFRADNERLTTIKQAAEKAYRYHMLGYKDPEEFNANVMLDLMNELGALL